MFEKVKIEIYGQIVEIERRDGKFVKPAILKTLEGYGSALKPAWEPIILARKPRQGTYAQCAVEHGAGALWIDGCRIGTELVGARSSNEDGMTRRNMAFGMKEFGGNPTQGRWPANVLLSCSCEAIDWCDCEE